VLFNKRPFPELDNDYLALTTIQNRQSPWKWNDAMPLEKILSTCCHPREESRPSIDTILQKLHPFFNPSPAADAAVKDPSTATSSTRRLGLINFGRAIVGSIILVCIGLSWIMRARIAQSWPMTAAARVTTTWILFPLTQNTWLIIENLMAISLKRFIMAWIVVGPIIAAWLTTSWAETSRTLLSCTRRSAPVLILFALKSLSGDRITIADPHSRLSHMERCGTKLGIARVDRDKFGGHKPDRNRLGSAGH